MERIGRNDFEEREGNGRTEGDVTSDAATSTSTAHGYPDPPRQLIGQ